jgi:hypothetical protein
MLRYVFCRAIRQHHCDCTHGRWLTSSPTPPSHAHAHFQGFGTALTLNRRCPRPPPLPTSGTLFGSPFCRGLVFLSVSPTPPIPNTSGPLGPLSSSSLSRKVAPEGAHASKWQWLLALRHSACVSVLCLPREHGENSRQSHHPLTPGPRVHRVGERLVLVVVVIGASPEPAPTAPRSPRLRGGGPFFFSFITNQTKRMPWSGEWLWCGAQLEACKLPSGWWGCTM